MFIVPFHFSPTILPCFGGGGKITFHCLPGSSKQKRSSASVATSNSAWMLAVLMSVPENCQRRAQSRGGVSFCRFPYRLLGDTRKMRREFSKTRQKYSPTEKLYQNFSSFQHWIQGRHILQHAGKEKSRNEGFSNPGPSSWWCRIAICLAICSGEPRTASLAGVLIYVTALSGEEQVFLKRRKKSWIMFEDNDTYAVLLDVYYSQCDPGSQLQHRASRT